MPLTQVAPPYPIFADLDGTPLDSGYIYLGSVNQNPETAPIPVYWDQNLSIPAVQPIRTIGGYPARNGTPAVLYTDGTFSITVRDKRRSLVFYSPVGYAVNTNSVAADANIQLVAANIGDVNTVAANLADIDAVAADMGSIDAVAGDLGGTWGQGVTYDFGSVADAPVGVISPPGGNIVIVATNIADVQTVGASIADIQAVVADLASITSVAADLVNIDLVAGDLANIDIVAADITSVVTVATNIAAILASVAGALQRVLNLSDLTDVAAARGNLGLGSVAVLNEIGVANLAATLDYGSIV
jgi:hypothetical protein